MNYRQFKQIIDDAGVDDTARIYIEQELGKDVYLQTEVMTVRKEQNVDGAQLIIIGTTGR